MQENQKNDQKPAAPRRPIGEVKKEMIDKYGAQAQVVVQNTSETRSLINQAKRLDLGFAIVRSQMYGKLPGEFGALALMDYSEAIARLGAVERRLGILSINRNQIETFQRRKDINPVPFNADRILRFHTDKVDEFMIAAEKAVASLRMMGEDFEQLANDLAVIGEKYSQKKQDAKAREEAQKLAAKEKAKEERAARHAEHIRRQKEEADKRKAERAAQREAEKKTQETAAAESDETAQPTVADEKTPAKKKKDAA